MPHSRSIDEVKQILCATLQLGAHGQALTAQSALLGALAELDSMAVLQIITALEDHFGISIQDEDISGKSFATLGSLSALVDDKLAA